MRGTNAVQFDKSWVRRIMREEKTMLDGINMKKQNPYGFDPDFYYNNPAGFGPEDDRESSKYLISQLTVSSKAS